MNITGHPFSDALLGGILIGLASALLLIGKGRIFGISGVIAGVLAPKAHDTLWRVAILAGLLLGGVPVAMFYPEKFTNPFSSNYLAVVVAGLLVGFGTQLGSGCTSGHGVCGISRMSPRSLVATIVFMLTGGLTVFFMH